MIVVVIMGMGGGFGFGFCQHFLELAFHAFAVDGDAAIFRGSRSSTMHEVSRAGFVRRKSGFNQRKMRRAAAFVGRSTAVTSEAHSNEKINE